MTIIRAFTIALTTVVLSASFSVAQGIEGTYRLVARDLPDGTRVEHPDIEGLITFRDGYRNFNIYWIDENGNPYSIGIFATYTFDGSEYTETNVFTSIVDLSTDDGIIHDLEPHTGTAAVTVSDGTIAFDLPLRDEPHVEFTADGVTASIEGQFVDHWERVE